MLAEASVLVHRPQVVENSSSFVFCATGKTGLGHLRRITNIAVALKRQTAAARVHLITNARVAGLDEKEAALFASVTIAAREHMAAAAIERGPSMIIVDTAVIPGLYRAPVPLCLVLRETTSEKLLRFALEQGRRWDLVCIPNPKTHWMPNPHAIKALRCEAVGWVFRHDAAPAQPGSNRGADDRHRVLVASGGGGNSDIGDYLRVQIDNTLRAARAYADRPIEVTQAIGPRAAKTSRLCEADAVLDPGSGLNRAFAEYDLVISTVGYNSILELACVDTPALLVPVPRSYDDQTARACQWAPELGLAHAPGDAARSAVWMVKTLRDRYRRKPVDFGPPGSERCARLLQELAQ